ncbi:MAG: glycosyltransferase family 1 protein [Pedobacter sp.]|nr:MAG: glycosyltransferase family 1 protein [Pedobacter sp.]
MNKIGQTVLVVCDSPKSLIDFRGKLIQEMAMKHHVVVFTPTIKQDYLRIRLNAMNITIYENELEGSRVTVYGDLKFIFKLGRLILKVKPDVVFPYTFKPVIYASMISRMCRVKQIVPMLTGLGYNFTSDRKRNWVSRITSGLLKISLINKSGMKVVFQNGDDYKTLVEQKIISTQHKCFIVNGSGVDLDHYKYTLPKTDPITFLMISRLINAKGIKEFYGAALSVKKKFPEVKCILIGAYDNNIDSISPELFHQITTDGTIDYLGEVHDVRPYIINSSVVVLPSYYGEGIPRCLLEAMAMGRAIITCESVGCRETVSTIKPINGFLVPIKDIDALAEKMEEFILNKSLIEIYGLNGLLIAKEKFDVEIINKQMLQIMNLD